MADQLPIPTFHSLDEIYPSSSAAIREGTRWSQLVETFQEEHGHPPSHVVRAPGRVNILGEHIDYSLFPVLPAAIEQDVLLALRPTPDPVVRLSNVGTKYKPCDFEISSPSAQRSRFGHAQAVTKGKELAQDAWTVDFVSPANGGGWENYVKVAVAECCSRFFAGGQGRAAPRGMEVVVSGTVPPGSGLSSSAALVVGSVIAFLVANGLTEGITKGDIVGLAMASEHRMGLQTGGMDVSLTRTFRMAASSLLSLRPPLLPLHLSFFPCLAPEPLPLPPSLAIVITNSLTPHSLADTAPEQYNLRVVESLCAARLLLHAWGLSRHERVRGKAGEEAQVWLREVLEMRWALDGEVGEGEYEAALEELEKVLGGAGTGERGWTREEMVEASGMGEEEFAETYLDFIEIRATRFHLLRRAQHTLSEALRVSRFTEICHAFAQDTAVGERRGTASCCAAHAAQRRLICGFPMANGQASSLNCGHAQPTRSEERRRKVCSQAGHGMGYGHGAYGFEVDADRLRVKYLERPQSGVDGHPDGYVRRHNGANGSVETNGMNGTNHPNGVDIAHHAPPDPLGPLSLPRGGESPAPQYTMTGTKHNGHCHDSIPAVVLDPRLAELGALLVESHESCRTLYDCTHPQTDELQRLCMECGAIGARQTGGGWGGAIISLVPTDKAQPFLQRVKRSYGPYQGLTQAEVDEAAFATLPGSGAGVYVLDDGVGVFARVA